MPCTSKELYYIVHENEATNVTGETMMAMELHCYYGHIALSIACWLVKNGLVSRLNFDDIKDRGIFCESCIYAKVTHKLIIKI